MRRARPPHLHRKIQNPFPPSSMSFRSKGTGRTLLPFGLDYTDVLSSNHDAEGPQLIMPINAPLNQREQAEAKQTISFANITLDGPFYTGLSPDPEANRSDQASSSDGIERHSDRYKKVKKVGRTIDEHPYQLHLFPQELYPVMGISNKKKKKQLTLSSYKSNGGLKQYDIKPNEEGVEGGEGAETAVSTNEDEAKLMVEKLKDMAENLDNGEEKDENNEDQEEEVQDEFDDEDDDDYNAEKYFDDGDDEYGDNDDDEAAF